MKAFLNWSGGKDSALCFWTAQQQGLQVSALVTTVRDREIPMHGVSLSLLEAQAAAMNLPLHLVHLEAFDNYENAIGSKNRELKEAGFTHVLSGDLFLEDLRQYREGLYSRDGFQTLFPLWKLPAAVILQPFREKSFQAIVVSVNGRYLAPHFCGRPLDADFLQSLPPGVDPCGERGEYHSFVYNAPFFRQPVLFEKGKSYTRYFDAPGGEESGGPAIPFYFCELQLQDKVTQEGQERP